MKLKIFVAVAYFLAGQAKDLPASLYKYIQGVPGGMCHISGGCSLC